MQSTGLILLAEDDPNDAFLFQRALERSDRRHTLFVVPDGQQCIDYLEGEGLYADRAQFPFPSLLMLDIKMPRLSGLEVLSWLQTQPEFRRLPVAVLTGSVIQEDRDRVVALGAAFYVKPTESSELVSIIKSVSARLS